jgi:hypothetical protein
MEIKMAEQDVDKATEIDRITKCIIALKRTVGIAKFVPGMMGYAIGFEYDPVVNSLTEPYRTLGFIGVSILKVASTYILIDGVKDIVDYIDYYKNLKLHKTK